MDKTINADSQQQAGSAHLTLEQRSQRFYRRLGRAAKRGGGMRLDPQDVDDLAYYFSTEISCWLGSGESAQRGSERHAGQRAAEA